jgi:hypothetical protein
MGRVAARNGQTGQIAIHFLYRPGLTHLDQIERFESPRWVGLLEMPLPCAALSRLCAFSAAIPHSRQARNIYTARCRARYLRLRALLTATLPLLPRVCRHTPAARDSPLPCLPLTVALLSVPPDSTGSARIRTTPGQWSSPPAVGASGLGRSIPPKRPPQRTMLPAGGSGGAGSS